MVAGSGYLKVSVLAEHQDEHRGAVEKVYTHLTDQLPRCKQRGIECHSLLDSACPVLDTGESSSFLWIPASAGTTATAASRGE
jgi:hypothetical protein